MSVSSASLVEPTATTHATAPASDSSSDSPLESNLSSYCLVGDNTVVRWYDNLVSQQRITHNPRQAEAAALLQTLANDLRQPSDNASLSADNVLQKLQQWFASDKNDNERAAPQGVYLHGSVGCGKSLLMDGFYLQLPVHRKLRVHFHQFMRRLHEDMKACENETDPLMQVAARIAERYDVICFDEFHVSDITDAMLLGRLLETLLAAQVRFVMTSNYPPAGLYPNGLARDRFLPTIALLEKSFTLFDFGEQDDYRLQALAQHDSYFTPADDTAHARMQAIFETLSCNIQIRKPLRLSNRVVPVIARGPDCAWFDFQSLCADARSKQDYLQLTERFSTVLLSNLPSLAGNQRLDAARRFTWLVDILYDERVKLIASSDYALADLYGDDDGGESGRTLSRLFEMQSADFAVGKKLSAA